MDPCPDLTECTIAGCSADAPDVVAVIWGGDFCGGAWVNLVVADGTGRVRAVDAQAADPYGEVTFTVELDGQATTECSLVGLPTGAIRYQLVCFEGDTSVYAAVLEDMGAPGCQPCPDATGCYDIDAPPVICDFPPCPAFPERGHIEGGGCRADIRIEEEPAPSLRGWVAHDGTLSVTAEETADSPSVVCSLPSTETGGFGPAVCIFDGTETPVEVDLALSPTGTAECALPQCVSAATCELLRIGNACTQGACSCNEGAACLDGEACSDEYGCVAVEMLDGPRVCTDDADCKPCLVGANPACCDQFYDGSALEAVNVYHACPDCCTCELACGSDIPSVTGIHCVGGRCEYTLD
jgi:hypothetical protein